MTEYIDNPGGPENKLSERERMGLSEIEWEMYQQFLEQNPEVPVERRDAEAEVKKLERLMDAFEASYPLQTLHAIESLSLKESPYHPIRSFAKRALNDILTALTVLKDQTNIAPEKYAELFARYGTFSRAVGIFNKGKLDHTRKP